MSEILSATMAMCCAIPLKDLNWYQRTSVLIMELLIILTIFLECVSSSEAEFVTHPGDLSVVEGESGSFNCTVKSSLPFSAANSHWENSLTEPINQSSTYNITTTSDNITRTVASHLFIHRVQRDMSMLYRCWIIIKVTNDFPIALSSEFANLNVLYFLKNSELHCRGPSDHMLQDGDKVVVECEGVQTNPPSVLRWLRPVSASFSYSQSGSLLVGNITITPLLHNRVMVCVAESEAFPVQVNCSLGPYTVIRSPVVEVVPHYAEMIWPSVTEIAFQCIASGHPKVKQYKWFCHPPEIFLQCTSYSPNITIILGKIQRDETVNISCEASSELTTAQNSSVVNVRHMADVDVCKSKSKYLPGMAYKGVPFLLYDDTKYTLKCLTEVKSIMEEIRFKWYLDGHLVSENNGDHDIFKSSEGSSHLIVYKLLKVNKQGIAACNVIYTKSKNMSLEHLVTCKLSRAEVENPMASITNSLQSTSMADNESYPVGQGGYSNEILKAVPIGIGCGMLFCIVLIILASRRLVVCRTVETHTSCTAAQLSDLEGIPSRLHGSTSLDHDGDLPVYEVPDVDLERSTTRKFFSIVSECEPGIRRVNIDRYLEEGGEGGGGGGGEEEEEEEEEEEGGGGGGGERESFLDSSDESKESDSNSSVDNQDMSVSSSTNKNEIPGLRNDYENHKVIESLIGNTRSKYFRRKWQNQASSVDMNVG